MGSLPTYTPIIPDYSFIATAGQQLGQALGEIPNVVKAAQVIKKEEATKDQVRTAVLQHIEELPDDVIQRMGTTKQDLKNTVPAPYPGRKKESLSDFVKRVSAWYTPVVRDLRDPNKGNMSLEAITGSIGYMPSEVQGEEGMKGELATLKAMRTGEIGAEVIGGGTPSQAGGAAAGTTTAPAGNAPAPTAPASAAPARSPSQAGGLSMAGGRMGYSFGAGAANAPAGPGEPGGGGGGGGGPGYSFGQAPQTPPSQFATGAPAPTAAPAVAPEAPRSQFAPAAPATQTPVGGAGQTPVETGGAGQTLDRRRRADETYTEMLRRTGDPVLSKQMADYVAQAETNETRVGIAAGTTAQRQLDREQRAYDNAQYRKIAWSRVEVDRQGVKDKQSTEVFGDLFKHLTKLDESITKHDINAQKASDQANFSTKGEELVAKDLETKEYSQVVKISDWFTKLQPEERAQVTKGEIQAMIIAAGDDAKLGIAFDPVAYSKAHDVLVRQGRGRSPVPNPNPSSGGDGKTTKEQADLDRIFGGSL